MILKRYTKATNTEVFEKESGPAFRMKNLALAFQTVSGATEAAGIFLFLMYFVPVPWMWLKVPLCAVSAFYTAKSIEVLYFNSLEYVSMNERPSGDFFQNMMKNWNMMLVLLVGMGCLSIFVSKRISQDTLETWILKAEEKEEAKTIEDFSGGYDDKIKDIEISSSHSSSEIEEQFSGIIKAQQNKFEAKIREKEKSIQYYREKEKKSLEEVKEGRREKPLLYSSKINWLERQIEKDRATLADSISSIEARKLAMINKEASFNSDLKSTYKVLQDSLMLTGVGGYIEAKEKSRKWAKTIATWLSWLAGFCTIFAAVCWKFFFNFLERSGMKPKMVAPSDFFQASWLAETMLLIELKFARSVRNKVRDGLSKLEGLKDLPEEMFNMKNETEGSPGVFQADTTAEVIDEKNLASDPRVKEIIQNAINEAMKNVEAKPVNIPIIKETVDPGGSSEKIVIDGDVNIHMNVHPGKEPTITFTNSRGKKSEKTLAQFKKHLPSYEKRLAEAKEDLKELMLKGGTNDQIKAKKSSIVTNARNVLIYKESIKALERLKNNM